MTARTLAHQLAAYAAAGTLTEVAAFLASIPATNQVTLVGWTAVAAVLAGWPALHAADAVARRVGGAA